MVYPELVNISGFRFVHHSRSTGRGGGVGFYIKDELPCHVKNVCPYVDSQFEKIIFKNIIETCIGSKKYILCNIYRAPSGTDNE
jgi:hypothetical protein